MKCEKKFLSRLNLKNRKVVYNAFINVEEIILRVCVSIPQIKYNLNVANTSLYAFFPFFFNLITQNHMWSTPVNTVYNRYEYALKS